jgi:AraC-like DNA-binding protein
MNFPLKIIGLHSRTMDTNYSTPLHSHQFYQWYYVNEGAIKYWTNYGEYVLKANDSILVAPGVFREVFNVGEIVNYFVISFEVSDISIPNFKVQLFHLGPSLRNEAAVLNKEILSPSFLNSSVFVHVLLARIILELFREIENIAMGKGKISWKNNELVNAIDNFLYSNLSNPITRQDVSRYCGFSEVHAARIFKEFTGKTIVERLTELRLQSAEKLLLTSDMPIAEISTAVGFNSLSHFTQLFRKVVGKSPSDFRNKTSP